MSHPLPPHVTFYTRHMPVTYPSHATHVCPALCATPPPSCTATPPTHPLPPHTTTCRMLLPEPPLTHAPLPSHSAHGTATNGDSDFPWYVPISSLDRVETGMGLFPPPDTWASVKALLLPFSFPTRSYASPNGNGFRLPPHDLKCLTLITVSGAQLHLQVGGGAGSCCTCRWEGGGSSCSQRDHSEGW